MDEVFDETAVVFGRENNLIGILGRPRTPTPGRPGLLFINAGVEHRVGPRGLYTALARSLNEAGFATLRFDFGGLGESRKPAVPASRDRVEEMRSECAAAAGLLLERGDCPAIVVCGLCSGADDAFRYTLVDERVRGAIMIDGYALPTAGFHARYYLQRLASPRRWRNAWQRLTGPRRPAPAAVDVTGADDMYFFTTPERDVLAGELEQLIARDVRLFLAYSGAAQQVYNYGRQFTDAFSELDLEGVLSEHYLPEADHTFSRFDARARLIARLVDWMREQFGGPDTATRPAAQARD